MIPLNSYFDHNDFHPPELIWVGSTAASEAQTALSHISNSARVRCCPDLATLWLWVGRQLPPPAAILLFENYPGELNRADQGIIAAAWPLVPWCHLTTAWHEGENRSGIPWPLAQRIPCAEFPLWWRQRSFSPEKHQLNGATRLPHPFPTQSLAEQILLTAEFTSGEQSAASGGLLPSHRPLEVIEVWGRAASLRDSVCQAISTLGYQARQFTSDHQTHGNATPPMMTTPAAVVLCGAGALDSILSAWVNYQQTYPGVPGIALVDFPRDYERRQLLLAGLAAVLAQPFALPMLAGALRTIIKPVTTM
ncbi:MAG: hypothetical protein SFX18_15130 [Pirellulales bacterium]|nr:hypothetical protein [Pirellulales bacterium]